MVYLIYDSSFQGLLTAIFEVYERKLEEVCICTKNREIPLLFAEVMEVITNETKAQRVSKKLALLLGDEGLRDLWRCWLSELEETGDVILGLVRYVLLAGKNVLNDFGDPYVLRLQEILKMMGREKHRMEAFVRFQKTTDGLYYAVVEPDFNVLPLIADHFSKRYADQRWIIYDQRRKYGLFFDLMTTNYITLDQSEHMQQGRPGKTILDVKEKLYQVLWKDYFGSTNIQSRKNTTLHIKHVPRRYWKYLTEKQ